MEQTVINLYTLYTTLYFIGMFGLLLASLVAFFGTATFWLIKDIESREPKNQVISPSEGETKPQSSTEGA